MIKQEPTAQSNIYILLISVHGLIRANDMELGVDADTGGQSIYVAELAKALAANKDVSQVDLLTRLIDDPNISPDYAQPEEALCKNAKIIRLGCGPKRYLRKESLWPHLDQMVDKCLHYIRQQGRVPDVIHSHYADAGYVGRQLSMLLGIPQVHTGHSLGRPKQERLLSSGRKESAIEKQFNFERRINVEEDVIQHASLIVTSTRQEVDSQYGMYRNADGSHFKVIPPGIDMSRFSAPGRKKIDESLSAEIDRFLSNPAKPIILCICRPEVRKNIKGLIEAYGKSEKLQKIANLVLLAGSREDIRELEQTQQKVMNNLLLDIDFYNLWGKVAIPKHISQDHIPELYRYAAKSKGIFINAAFTEPFGLTLIEAAASGLPFVAPDDGGPRDIIAHCHNGLLANTLESQSISDNLLEALSDKARWRKWSKNGLVNSKRYYTWDGHVAQYMKEVRNLLYKERKNLRKQHAALNVGKSPIPLAKSAFITDIDNTLIGDKEGVEQLVEWLKQNAGYSVFGIATGRPIESAVDMLKKHRVPIPDVLITSVGSEIHYGAALTPDVGWANHIRHLWRREELVKAMQSIDGIRLQTEDNQREFKISYLVDEATMPSVEALYQHLNTFNLRAQIIYSHGEFLDILPIRASKGHAIRYLAYKWGLPLEQFLVSGDSGNDTEMLLGDTLAVVVGNHSVELEKLKGIEKIYFAQQHYAKGILEGISHYNFGRPQ
jgi:sucrose-phosphate synthase